MDARKDNTAAPCDTLHTPLDTRKTDNKKALPARKRFFDSFKDLALADVHHLEESINVDICK